MAKPVTMLPVRNGPRVSFSKPVEEATTNIHTKSTTTAPNIAGQKHSITPPESDRMSRTSFSSIHENNSGVAQTFTDRRELREEYERQGVEHAVEDEKDYSGSENEKNQKIMLHPDSALHGAVCPCGSFRGWKEISIGGKRASKSSSDLKSLARGWNWDPKPVVKVKTGKLDAKGRNEDGLYPAGRSPFEKLPNELLNSIILHLVTDIPPNGFTARNVDLMAMMLTSRNIHSATLATLYANITFPHSRIFAKFLRHITEYPSLGTIVRRLDFSHFNPTGAGMSRRERMETLNLIPSTLLSCLSLTPNLREFLAQEHIDDDLSAEVLTKVLQFPKLRSLDLCACSSTTFRDAFSTVLANPLPILTISRLSLHECTILPVATYTTLLPLLPGLTHLDVAHTRITPAALLAIPTSARLTHLNLARCASLSGESVVEFLTSHPAAPSLVYLNLATDIVHSEPLLSDADLDNLLPVLGQRKALRSLSLKGSEMQPKHIPLLAPMSKFLEELGLGQHLTLSDITPLLIPPTKSTPYEIKIEMMDTSFLPGTVEDEEEEQEWHPHTLHYVDASSLSLASLDLSTLFSSRCSILSSSTSPLEVLEVNSEVHAKLAKSSVVVSRAGWVVKEVGRRYWLVRNSKSTGEVNGGDGARWWKCGATFWGMRKVPVVWAEVGGLYAHYMFKR